MYSIILNCGEKIHIKYCLNSCSEYVVHLAKCPHGSIYVGDSSKMLKIKILEYKSAVSEWELGNGRNDTIPMRVRSFSFISHQNRVYIAKQ